MDSLLLDGSSGSMPDGEDVRWIETTAPAPDASIITFFSLVTPFLDAECGLANTSVVVAGLLARQSPATDASRHYEQQLEAHAALDAHAAEYDSISPVPVIFLLGVCRLVSGSQHRCPSTELVARPLRPAAAALQRIEAHSCATSYVILAHSLPCVVDTCPHYFVSAGGLLQRPPRSASA